MVNVTADNPTKYIVLANLRQARLSFIRIHPDGTPGRSLGQRPHLDVGIFLWWHQVNPPPGHHRGT